MFIDNNYIPVVHHARPRTSARPARRPPTCASSTPKSTPTPTTRARPTSRSPTAARTSAAPSAGSTPPSASSAPATAASTTCSAAASAVRPSARWTASTRGSIGENVAARARASSVNSQLRRFSPRDPGEPLDGIGQYLYPSRPGAQKLSRSEELARDPVVVAQATCPSSPPPRFRPPLKEPPPRGRARTTGSRASSRAPRRPASPSSTGSTSGPR